MSHDHPPMSLFSVLHLPIEDNVVLVKHNTDHLYCCLFCGKENVVRLDQERGEWTCENCGFVNQDHEVENRLPRQTEKAPQNDHYARQEISYQKKRLTPQDRRKIANKSIDYEHLLNFTDRYDNDEKKEKTVMNCMQTIQTVCNLNYSIFLTAFKHYKALQKMGVVRGKRVLNVCAAMMHIAAKELGVPLSINTMTTKIKEVVHPKFTKGDILRIKDLVSASGYRFDRRTLSPEDRVRAIFRTMREHPPENIQQHDLDRLECEAVRLVGRVPPAHQHGINIGTYAASFIFCAIQTSNIIIPTSTLTYHAGISEATLRTHLHTVYKLLPSDVTNRVRLQIKRN